MSLDLAYIRNTYGVPAKRGGKVTIKHDGEMIDGVLVGCRNSALRVEIAQGDGKTIVSVHPHRAIYHGGKA